MSIKEDYLTIKKVAKLYGVPLETVKGWIVSGLVPGEKIGQTHWMEKAKLPKCPQCGNFVVPDESRIPPVPPIET